jgi:hypothetical protein
MKKHLNNHGKIARISKKITKKYNKSKIKK